MKDRYERARSPAPYSGVEPFPHTNYSLLISKRVLLSDKLREKPPVLNRLAVMSIIGPLVVFCQGTKPFSPIRKGGFPQFRQDHKNVPELWLS